jgi:hypothetical protein
MKPSLFAAALVGVALAGLWYAGGGTQPLPVARAAADAPRVAAPLAHENLSVYFVYGPSTVTDAKVMSLSEALESGQAIVHETENVNTLAVENCSSDYELFIQSGDIVKGGKQDRMASLDMLLPPKSGRVPLPAHCVEQSRWTGRGQEDARRFAKCDNFAVGKDLKYANATYQQGAVWENVKGNQDKLRASLKAEVNAAASPTSFQLTLESPAVQAKIAEYEAALKAAGEDRDGVIGVVFVVNGQITGAEVYGSNALFRKAWPKLLKSAAVEAVAERTDQPTAPPPTAREVERFLAHGAAAEANAPGGPGSITDGTSNELDRGWVEVAGRAGNRWGAPIEQVLHTEVRAPRELNRVSLTDRQGAPVQTEGRPAQTEGQQPAVQQPAARAQTVNPTAAAQDNIIMNGSGAGRAALPEQPANPEGNRLQSNRSENRSALMVESRDAGRQNAVIHRSYIKK